MKRQFRDVADAFPSLDEEEASRPKSRNTGFTDAELESRFVSRDDKGEDLMDEETVRRMMRQQRADEQARSRKAEAEAKAAADSRRRAAAEAEERAEVERRAAEERAAAEAAARAASASSASAPRSFAPGAASEASAPTLRPGDAIIVKGLKAAAHLNGQRGRLGPFDSTSGRWEVMIAGSDDIKAIKPENLEPAPGDNLSAADHFVPPPSPERDPPIAPRSPPQAPLGAPADGRLGGGLAAGVAGLSSASFAVAPGAAAGAGGSRPSSVAKHRTTRKQGTVRWYNGRRKIGKIIPDGGGDDLFIPAQGALNGSQVPPQPGGLFHGTRVSYIPASIDSEKGGGLEALATRTKKTVCMDVRPLPGQIGLTCGVDTNKGAKETNDDRVAACDLHELGFFAGVFDGHRGHHCADHLAKQLPAAVLSSYRARVKREGGPTGVGISRLSGAQEVSLITRALEDAFDSTDKAFLTLARKKEMRDGSTAVVGLLTHGFDAPIPVSVPSGEGGAAGLWAKVAKKLGRDEESGGGDAAASAGSLAPERPAGTVAAAPGGISKLFIAWCGDSRAILVRGRQGLRLSEDHRPQRKDERERIQRAGGFIGQDAHGVWRVGPKEESKLAKELQKKGKKDAAKMRWFLSTSRSFGDFELKQPDPIVSSTPEVKVVDLAPDDWAVVLACDGVWDVLSDQQVANVACKAMGRDGKDPVAASKAIVQAALGAGSRDNITVVIMRLGWASPPSGDAVAANAAASKDDDMFG